jgi:hypothetical protein
MRDTRLASVLAFVTLAALAGACSDDSTPSADASTAIDAPVVTIDAAPGTPDAAVAPIDAAPGTPDAPPATTDAPPASIGVQCGETLCTDTCCVDTSGSTMACQTEACASGQVPATCDGTEDCSGEGMLCCAAFSGTSATVGCATTCSLAQVVHTAGECPTGATFCPVMTTAGYCWSYGACPF